METILTVALHGALVVHLALIAACVWRVWRGENVIDRLIGADVVGTLTLAVLVILALIQCNALYIDVALALAALGAIGTIVLAKYLADERLL